MGVSEHAQSDGLLVPFEQSSKPGLVLVGALVSNVPHQDDSLAKSFSFDKLQLKEADLLVGIVQLTPDVHVVVVAAFSIEGDDSRVEFRDEFGVVAVAVVACLLIFRHPHR